MNIFSHLLFPDDVISLASSSVLVGDDGEDDELRAAASHLCSTVCAEDGGGNEQERDREKSTPTKRPSLALLLGALPTAASLGLPESITKMGEEKENGKIVTPLSSCTGFLPTQIGKVLKFDLSNLQVWKNMEKRKQSVENICISRLLPLVCFL